MSDKGKRRVVIPRGEQELVYVKWLDAHSNGCWKTLKELEEYINNEDCICENVGWVVYRSKKLLCMSCRRLYWAEENVGDNTYEYGQFQSIPRPWIVEEIKLKGVKK